MPKRPALLAFMRRESPSEYLEKYRQVPVDAETQKRIDSLSTPWAEVEYQDVGEVDVTHRDLRLSFEYRVVPKDASVAFTEKGRQHEIYFELSQLEIEKVEDGDIKRKMQDVLPGDYRVYFSLSDKGETCYVNLDQKRIVLHGDPTSPRIFLALFHEIGHIYENRSEKVFAPQLFTNRKSVDVIDLAEKVHSERDAWAFAFKYLRPLLARGTVGPSALSSDDALAFAKNVALHSYSEGAEYDAAQRRSMSHFAWDYVDDYENDYLFQDPDIEEKDQE